jgi:hypothetical protein
MQSDGSVTCPELWGVPPTRDAWQKKKEFRDCDTFDEAVAKRIATIRSHSGEPGWWAGYQQNPSVNELATFTDDNIDDAKDYQRGIGAGEAGDYVALSLDPALGGGNALTAAVHGVDLLTVLDQKVTYNLARVEDILNGIEEFARLYFPQILIVERDSFQKSLAGDLRLAALSARYGFHVLPHTTTRNKADPLLGVASMASSFILKEVRLPWGDELARSRMDALVGQLRAWRPTVATKLLTQDAVMSLWFNWRYWTENKMARGDGDMHSSWNRGGTPYAPTPYATVTV